MSLEDSDESESGNSEAVIWWLFAVALSFLLGFAFLELLPGASGAIWSSGTATNVAMAIAVGILLGWTRRWLHVLFAITLGAIVTVLGVDLLVLAPTSTENAHVGVLGLVLFDSVAVLFALIGMAILVGGGAIAGALAHAVVSHRRCPAMAKVALMQHRKSGEIRRNHLGRELLSVQ